MSMDASIRSSGLCTCNRHPRFLSLNTPLSHILCVYLMYYHSKIVAFFCSVTIFPIVSTTIIELLLKKSSHSCLSPLDICLSLMPQGLERTKVPDLGPSLNT